MIQRLDLYHFKAFSRFTVSFRPQTFLVGPNNAGKSTVIAGLRACSNMLRTARRVNADRAIRGPDAGSAWAFSSTGVGLIEENLRHEFRPEETRLAPVSYTHLTLPTNREV